MSSASQLVNGVLTFIVIWFFYAKLVNSILNIVKKILDKMAQKNMLYSKQLLLLLLLHDYYYLIYLRRKNAHR